VSIIKEVLGESKKVPKCEVSRGVKGEMENYGKKVPGYLSAEGEEQ